MSCCSVNLFQEKNEIKQSPRLLLSKSETVVGIQGKDYRLAVQPDQCKIGDILRLTEGDLAPVACLQKEAAPCEKAESCPTINMWREFYEVVNGFFDGKMLSELM